MHLSTILADQKRFELLTSGSANRRSILLNYGSVCNYIYIICSLNVIVKYFGGPARIRTWIAL